jgi:DNA-binding Lrp family transcriptional regulator
MTCVFIQLRCKPGRTYQVADAIYDREFVSELYSTSGDWDLIMKVYVPEGEDVGRFVNEKLVDIADVERSLTTMTFRAF